jgi:16S rRNA (guanine527-N7)-methyltransferase
MARTTQFGSVSRETEERLSVFSNLLIRWNHRINLVGSTTVEEIQKRHIVDSLQLLPLAPPGARTWIDLGSGAGFPGLVCAIALQEINPVISVTLVESDQRKAAFLREAARHLSVPVTIHAKRIEQLDPDPADLISARALAPLPKLLDLASKFVHPASTLLFPKGRRAESELTEALRSWHITAELITSVTDPAATILKITDICRKS